MSQTLRYLVQDDSSARPTEMRELKYFVTTTEEQDHDLDVHTSVLLNQNHRY